MSLGTLVIRNVISPSVTAVTSSFSLADAGVHFQHQVVSCTQRLLKLHPAQEYIYIGP